MALLENANMHFQNDINKTTETGLRNVKDSPKFKSFEIYTVTSPLIARAWTTELSQPKHAHFSPIVAMLNPQIVVF